MNLFETLKQFKRIEPDRSFTEKSKRAILASSQNIPMNPFRGILQIIETGSAVVLAGFFILLITGAFSDSPYVAPVQYSVIDAAGLHAEAQAIDAQIELAQLSYTEGVATAPAEFASKATSSALSTSMAAATSSMTVAPTAAEPGSAASTSTPSSTVSVDQALSQLAK